MMALFSGKSEKNDSSGRGRFEAHKEKKKTKEQLEEEAREKTMAHAVTGVNTRLTLLEDRYNTVREQIGFAERSLVEGRENTNKKIRVLDSELNELNSEMKELKDKVLSLNEEIKRAAKEEQVRVIDKYLDLWEPLEFVTRQEVKKALDKIRK
jgi:outer membrane murein-binding lipoprotein Lpp